MSTEQLLESKDRYRNFPEILTVDDAASLLQVSAATIYRYSSEGRLRGFATRGSPLRIKRDPLVAWFFKEKSRRAARRRPRQSTRSG